MRGFPASATGAPMPVPEGELVIELLGVLSVEVF
jgi:hypothetical protein